MRQKVNGSNEEADVDLKGREKKAGLMYETETHKELRRRPSLLENAKWYQVPFYDWAFYLVERAQTSKLKLEDLGGLAEEELVQDKVKEVEAIFAEQKDKNIFVAVVWAFRKNYMFSFLG